MCVGYEGTLVAVSGRGVTRRGVLQIGGRQFEIGLSFVPDARPGDRVLAHTGQGVRVMPQRVVNRLTERA